MNQNLSRQDEKPFLGRSFDSRQRSYPDRRTGNDRRSIADRRARQIPFSGPDRRSGKERRERERRLKSVRIPIFLKLASLSTLLVFLVLSTTSVAIISKQKEQFVGQLLDLGESMVRHACSNAGGDIVRDDEIPLFQLVKNIADNEQVLFAVITDHKHVVKAHDRMQGLDKGFLKPVTKATLREKEGVRASTLDLNGEEVLFFEAPVRYQRIKVGEVCVAISQKKIYQSIHEAEVFVGLLALFMTALGILMSLGLSMYFSKPIRQLGESTRALGLGDFSHRVRMKRNDEFSDLAYAFNRMAEDLELQEKIKDSFGRYVTPEIVEMILANPDKRWMKGSKVDATVLFVDIRGFTSLSENVDPEAVVDLLNDYLTRVTNAVIKYGGHLNKFLGDEAMAVFGAPLANASHSEAAVKAALEIQREIEDLNGKRKIGQSTIGVGVGVNSGEMVAGNLGSEKKMEYTVIGDNVNVASRLTSIAKGGEILITKGSYDLLPNKEWLRVEERGSVPVKGRKGEITIYQVIAV
jgi:adenylate cyclase